MKASKKLHMTQPALSHQLKILEQDLGKPLFHRKGRKLVINEYGKAVQEYAHRIFRCSEEMIHFLNSEQKDFKKVIKIGTVPSMDQGQVYHLIRPLIFSQRISVEVFQKDLDSLLEDILDDQVDIILSDSSLSDRSDKLLAHRLESEAIVCVCAPKEHSNSTFPECLNDKNFVNFLEPCSLANKINDYLKSQNVEVELVGSFADSQLVKTTAERGGVYAFLPLSIARQSLIDKKLIQIGEIKDIQTTSWAITSKNYTSNSLIHAILHKKMGYG